MDENALYASCAKDFETLRASGLAHLQTLSGAPGTWTDFNTHDPGVTILEQLCYALSDLSYRADFSVADILASADADPQSALVPPQDILTTSAVTLGDMRRILLDTDGVANAWIAPARAAQYPLVADHHAQTLTASDGSPPLAIKGLFEVQIDVEDRPGPMLRRNRFRRGILADVARKLHAVRNVCEDFDVIRVVERDWIWVTASIEIADLPAEDVHTVFDQIMQSIAHHIARPVVFSDLEELLAEGMTVEEVFDGPKLRNGFLTDAALRQSERKDRLHSSDLIRRIMDVGAAHPGIARPELCEFILVHRLVPEV